MLLLQAKNYPFDKNKHFNHLGSALTVPIFCFNCKNIRNMEINK